MQTITPEQAGFSSARLGRLNTTMQGYIDEGILAGMIILLARKGQIFQFDCLGHMDRETGKAMQPDTIFRIYSMTKPITGAAMLMLYEEGRFLLDDPVSKYIPAFKDLPVLAAMTDRGPVVTDAKRQVTIRDLLTHTSGLGYGLFEDAPIEKLYRDTQMIGEKLTLQVSLDDMINILSQLPLAHQPGQAWRYSMGIDVIGYLIGLISGMPFDTFLKERIFNPLGMNDTAFYVPPEKIDRFAIMYGPTETNSLAVIDSPAASPFTNPNYNPAGGGGLVSTAADYLRFAQMLLNGGELDGVRLLGPKTVELMTSNHLPHTLLPLKLGDTTLPGYGYGLGVRVMVDVVRSGVLSSAGEYGWAGVAGTYFWIDPREELIGILLPQYLPSMLLPVPVREIFRILTYQALVK